MSKDMNYDGVYTITDLFLSIKQFLFSPGDWVIRHWILDTEFGTFFEYSSADYGGIASFVISLFVFVGIPMIIYLEIYKYFINVVGYKGDGFEFDSEYRIEREERSKKFYTLLAIPQFISALFYYELKSNTDS
jgi:hypothetical protein